MYRSPDDVKIVKKNLVYSKLIVFYTRRINLFSCLLVDNVIINIHNKQVANIILFCRCRLKLKMQCSIMNLIYKKSVLDSVKSVQDLTLTENAWLNITESNCLEIRQETEGGCR